jgi:hypothetical protein
LLRRVWPEFVYSPICSPCYPLHRQAWYDGPVNGSVTNSATSYCASALVSGEGWASAAIMSPSLSRLSSYRHFVNSLAFLCPDESSVFVVSARESPSSQSGLIYTLQSRVGTSGAIRWTVPLGDVPSFAPDTTDPAELAARSYADVLEALLPFSLAAGTSEAPLPATRRPHLLIAACDTPPHPL